MKKNHLAIFDLDGTLFDTTDVNYLAYKKALEECGFIISYEYYVDYCNGNHYKNFLPNILNNNDGELFEKIHERKKELYKYYLKDTKMNDHLFNIINSLENKYYIAIVTTASRDNTNDILNYFHVKKHFEHIITQEDVQFVKPNPEGFFLCMQHFNIAPEATIIFEDSNIGIQAAINSGARVLKVIN